jgi:hypothetical protein
VPPKGSKCSAEALAGHVRGLLNKVHQSAKLPGNTELKLAKEAKRKRELEEI